MKTKSIKKNYFYNLLYQVLILITPLITTPYLSRVLGANGIGEFSYVNSIATYFVLLGTLGSSLYGQREVAYFQDNILERTKIFKEVIILRIITTFISFIIFYIYFIKVNESIIYIILGVEIIAAAFDISWFFQGIEEFKKTVIRNIAIKIISVILVFILVKDKNDVSIYAICYVFPILIGNLSMWIYIPYFLESKRNSKINIFRHFKSMLLLFIPQLAIEVYTVLDKTMLGAICIDIAEVGYYEQSQKIIKIILRIITAMGIVMLPKIAHAFTKGEFDTIEKNIKKSFQFVFFLSFPMIFGLIGISSKFVPWFFGNGYEKVNGLLIIMSPIILIIGLSNIIGVQYLLPTKKQKIYTISVILGAALNFTLNILLIPNYNCYGAAIATIVAELGVLIYQIRMACKYIPIYNYLQNIYQYIIVSAIMGVVLIIVGEFLSANILTTCFQILLGVVIYFTGLLLLKNSVIIQYISRIQKIKMKRVR